MIDDSGWVTVGRSFSQGYNALGVFLAVIATGASAMALAMAYLLIWVGGSLEFVSKSYSHRFILYYKKKIGP